MYSFLKAFSVLIDETVKSIPILCSKISYWILEWFLAYFTWSEIACLLI